MSEEVLESFRNLVLVVIVWVGSGNSTGMLIAM